ncbi:MAG: NAD-dependent epimerase/dehydratase family protein, partial [Candidatus Acidoferrales bacterium]
MSAWKGKVVAVTGAAGFLGSHLCEALVGEGAEVLGLDNFEAGQIEHLEPVRDQVQLIRYDITRADGEGVLAAAEVVYHLAARANPRACQKDFERTYRVNVEGTRRVLEACREGARVIFLSGAMAYGEPRVLPISEEHPLAARDPYSLSKIMGECLTWALAEARRLRATVVRNFSTYGPRQAPEYVVPRMIAQGLQQGEIDLWNTRPTRDFTYVEDTIRALRAIGESEALVGEVVNLGSGRETPIGELARTVARLLGGMPVRDRQREVSGSRRQCADNARLRRATGWQPQVALEEGLRRTIAWSQRRLPAAVTAPA